MAREFGKLWFELFQDDDFCDQPLLDKHLFSVLVGQQAFNYAGLSPMQMRKWAKGCRPATDLEIKAALVRLERNRYIFTDSDTEEVLIRSFIRRDLVEKQPNLLINALRSAAVVESPKLAAVLLAELDRITIPETTSAQLGDRMRVAFEDARRRLELRVRESSKPFREPFAEDFPEESLRPGELEPFAEGSPEGLSEPPVVVAVVVDNSRSIVDDFKDQKTSSSEKPPTSRDARRDDVEALCTRLYGRILANGSKAKITEKWRTEARLLLDKDGRELDKALNLIDWSQNDPFWKTNILSMPTFREKYDQLRLKALEEHNRRSPPGYPGPSKSDQKVQNILDIGARLINEGRNDTKEIRQ